MSKPGRLLVFLTVAVSGVFVWSLIGPHDYLTWILEVFPAIAGVAVLAATFGRFRFTSLLYALIAVHIVILLVGGHYTYALAPPGEWMKGWFGFARNDYDRIGHFAQGFVPALVAREVMIRLGIVRGRGWIAFFAFAVCMTVSALYELLEWQSALILGQGADAFLGTQGDPWDTQEDMAACGVGAIVALASLGRVHDRAIERAERPA